MESASDSKINEINHRSEEIQEILGTPPHWLVRWGLLSTLVFIVLAIWSLFWFSYPESVTAKMRLTKEDPPIELIVGSSTYIKDILVQSEDEVSAGQTIFVLASEASFEDVHTLDDQLLTLKNVADSVLLETKFPADLDLGEIEEDLLSFIQQQEVAKEEQYGRLRKMSLDDLQREIKQERNHIAYERSRITNLEAQLDLANTALQRERNLYQSGRGDFNRLRTAEGKAIDFENRIQEALNTIKIKQGGIRQLEQRLKDNEFRQEEGRQKSLEKLNDALDALQRAVHRWKRKYLLVSPIDGVVIMDQVNRNNYVQTDERVAVIVPVSASKLIGKAELPLDKSGQIKEGQKVIVDFYSFPALQYGAVEGVVSEKSKIPTQDNMLPIKIRFPDGLLTDSGQELAIGQDMRADITIILQEKRYIQWLLDRIRQ